MNKQIHKLTWDEMDNLHHIAANRVKQVGFCPEIVIGILRCGIVSAVHIAYILGVRRVGAIYAKTTPSDEVLVKKNIPPKVQIDFPREEILGKRVLLVDTVMASGTTISMGVEELATCRPSDIRTLIIIDWPNSPYKNQNLVRPMPDFIGDKIDCWPDFPWEH